MQVALRTVLWLALGGWVGSWTFFALVVARRAFQLLPETEAGRLVGPLLDVLHHYGIFAGLVLCGTALLLRRGWLLAGLPLVLAAVCAASQYLLTPAIAELSSRSFAVADADPAAAARFADLHRLSMELYSAVLLGAIALVPLHVLAERRAGTQAPETRTPDG